MGFKLMRVDENDTCKIQLETGKHLIGRGKLLHCDDKRVSRSHGELEVTENSINLKALHTNPCFYLKKGTTYRGMIKQNDSIDLGNGDKFGLLPVDCWYEVLYTADDVEMGQKPANQESQVQNGYISGTNRTALLDSTEIDNGFDDRTNSSLTLAAQSSNEIISDPPQPDNEPPPASPNASDMSQSLIQDLPLPIQDLQPSDPTQSISDPPEIPQDSCQNSLENSPVRIKTEPEDKDLVVTQSPLKRPLPSLSDVKQEHGEDEAKRIKNDPDNATAGTSSGQDAQNQAAPPGCAGPGALPPPQPNSYPRERCMYGANCYRRNPVHKQEFSHPCDADWAQSPRACPLGARCARRTRAHWALCTHPPGTLPPHQRHPPPQGNKQRPKKKRQSTDSEDSGQDTADSPDIILTGKRARKKVHVQTWSDSESNEEDPFGTDEDDEWQPSGSTDIDSQINSQDD